MSTTTKQLVKEVLVNYFEIEPNSDIKPIYLDDVGVELLSEAIQQVLEKRDEKEIQ